MWADCHGHFDRLDAGKVKEIVARAKQEEIESIIIVSMDLETSREAVHIAEAHDIVYAAVGIHPWNAAYTEIDEGIYQRLKTLASREKVVAIGETGLDFVGDAVHPERGAPDSCARELQKNAFIKQLGLARELGKPVIVHDRGATREMIDVLKEEKGVKAVLHDFIGDETMLQEAVGLGCYISEGMNILIPQCLVDQRIDTGKFKEMVKKIPSDRLLLETDCAPGYPEAVETFMPWDVKQVAEQIAQLRGTTAEELSMVVSNNLKRFLATTPTS
ncbi:TatD family hydrolase [Chloroflexota bacterium]